MRIRVKFPISKLNPINIHMGKTPISKIYPHNRNYAIQRAIANNEINQIYTCNSRSIGSSNMYSGPICKPLPAITNGDDYLSRENPIYSWDTNKGEEYEYKYTNSTTSY